MHWQSKAWCVRQGRNVSRCVGGDRAQASCPGTFVSRRPNLKRAASCSSSRHRSITIVLAPKHSTHLRVSTLSLSGASTTSICRLWFAWPIRSISRILRLIIFVEPSNFRVPAATRIDRLFPIRCHRFVFPISDKYVVARFLCATPTRVNFDNVIMCESRNALGDRVCVVSFHFQNY